MYASIREQNADNNRARLLRSTPLVYVSDPIGAAAGSGLFPFPPDSVCEEVVIWPLWAPIRDLDVRLAWLHPASARKLELVSGCWEDGGLRAQRTCISVFVSVRTQSFPPGFMSF